MNWFEDVFPLIIEYRGGLMEFWKLILFGSAPYLFALLVGWKSILLRLGALFGVGALLSMGPEFPVHFVDGRVGGFQNEVFAFFATMILGVLCLIKSLYRPTVRLIAGSIAALVFVSLSALYHMVLINGMDEAMRKVEVGILMSDFVESRGEICYTKGTICGSGLESLPTAPFEKDLRDWSQNLPHEKIFGGSNGTLSADPTYVWAAVRDDGDLKWVMRSYEEKSVIIETAFLTILTCVILFWLPGAALVEYLHARMMKRRRNFAPPSSLG